MAVHCKCQTFLCFPSLYWGHICFGSKFSFNIHFNDWGHNIFWLSLQHYLQFSVTVIPSLTKTLCSISRINLYLQTVILILNLVCIDMCRGMQKLGPLLAFPVSVSFLWQYWNWKAALNLSISQYWKVDILILFSNV